MNEKDKKKALPKNIINYPILTRTHSHTKIQFKYIYIDKEKL